MSDTKQKGNRKSTKNRQKDKENVDKGRTKKKIVSLSSKLNIEEMLEKFEGNLFSKFRTLLG